MADWLDEQIIFLGVALQHWMPLAAIVILVTGEPRRGEYKVFVEPLLRGLRHHAPVPPYTAGFSLYVYQRMLT